jgi:hypothetical protein
MYENVRSYDTAWPLLSVLGVNRPRLVIAWQVARSSADDPLDASMTQFSTRPWPLTVYVMAVVPSSTERRGEGKELPLIQNEK